MRKILWIFVIVFILSGCSYIEGIFYREEIKKLTKEIIQLQMKLVESEAIAANLDRVEMEIDEIKTVCIKKGFNISSWEKKYDSLRAVKSITPQSIKINKSQSGLFSSQIKLLEQTKKELAEKVKR